MFSIPDPILKDSIDYLNVHVYRNRDEMGAAAANDVALKMKELLEKKESIRMVFAAAPSQNEFLKALCTIDCLDWSRVTVFHMDDWIGLPEDAPQKFSNFLRARLFDSVKPGKVHLIDTLNLLENECRRYGDLLKEQPIDIVCLGIGENGHIAFNDPPFAKFDDDEVMKPVQLDEVCRYQQLNDEAFLTIEDVPTHALTLTVPTLMSGANLFCMVPGLRKRGALESTLRGPITEECPASILRRHPNCNLYTDTTAYGAGK